MNGRPIIDELEALEARRGWAAWVLAADLAAYHGLFAGFEVPRSRLRADVLRAIGEPADGPAVVLDDELALRAELARTVFARPVNLPRRERGAR
jgi:hypothetical protein